MNEVHFERTKSRFVKSKTMFFLMLSLGMGNLTNTATRKASCKLNIKLAECTPTKNWQKTLSTSLMKKKMYLYLYVN